MFTVFMALGRGEICHFTKDELDLLLKIMSSIKINTIAIQKSELCYCVKVDEKTVNLWNEDLVLFAWDATNLWYRYTNLNEKAGL